MANGKIRFGKQSGGELTLVIPDGVSNTEVIVPESGELTTKEYINNTAVKLTGNQTIADVKTFSSSPVVPTPTADFQVATKKYVDGLVEIKTIATGTATFTATTNNINLTGIGICVEIGDVIQISGAEDAKNNSEFTVEVITDNDNIIVNQAHANKGTSKNVANRASDTGVTVKLLAKWYNASDSLGRDWVDVTTARLEGTLYSNTTNRAVDINIRLLASGGTTAPYIEVNLKRTLSFQTISTATYSYVAGGSIPKNATYYIPPNEYYSIENWMEMR